MPETATISKPSLPSRSMIIPLLLWDPVGKSDDLTAEYASQFFLVSFGGITMHTRAERVVTSKGKAIIFT